MLRRHARTVGDSESDEDPEEILHQAYMAAVLNIPPLTQASTVLPWNHLLLSHQQCISWHDGRNNVG